MTDEQPICGEHLVLLPIGPCRRPPGHRPPHATSPGLTFDRDHRGAEWMSGQKPTDDELDNWDGR